MAFLVASNGPDAGRRYELDVEECVVGRHPDCHVVVDVGAVSRHHARIGQEEEAFFVEDLNSRNHTYVNEEMVTSRRLLRHGDRVSLCDISFVFHESEDPVVEDGSTGFSPVFVDDESPSSSSTIMSKLGMTSSQGQVQLTASPEVKLTALLKITQNLGRALKLDDVLPQVLNCLFDIFMQADRGYIALRNDDGTLIPKWAKTRREDAEGFRVSRTIARQVMESQEAILSVDAATDERFDMAQSIADFKIRSMMCAPLVDSDNSSIGVLQIDTVDQRKRFQQEDLEVLLSVATQAGVAIDNARLHEQAVKQRAIQKELEVAHEVQQGFLPTECPNLNGYEFFDYYEPANHVGGDYFDYIRMPDGRTAVIVADVVGHGVAAALLMAKLSAETRVALATESEPARAVTVLNRRLAGLQMDKFVTMVMVVIDDSNNRMTIVNAGHMPPIVRRADGSIEEPGADVSGLPLMILDDYDYEQAETELFEGDSITLYTDGVNESCDEEDNEYGMERVREKIAELDGTPADRSQELISDVRGFQAHQEDDMCVVAFGRSQTA